MEHQEPSTAFSEPPGGLRGAFLVIIVAGLNIFSGGGTLAHLGGLFTGLVLRKYGDDLARFFNLKGPGPGGPAF